MPHIIVEFSQNMAPDLDLPEMLIDLHETLAANGVDKARIKSRSIPIIHSVVGHNAPNEGQMAHLTLLLLEGRDIPLRQTFGRALYDVLIKHIRGPFPECALTLEVREMVKDTYIL